jgi:hypothetical protein
MRVKLEFSQRETKGEDIRIWSRKTRESGQDRIYYSRRFTCIFAMRNKIDFHGGKYSAFRASQKKDGEISFFSFFP